MARVAAFMLGFAAGVCAIFAILACGATSIWCFLCAIIAMVAGLILGGDD